MRITNGRREVTDAGPRDAQGVAGWPQVPSGIGHLQGEWHSRRDSSGIGEDNEFGFGLGRDSLSSQHGQYTKATQREVQ